MLGAHVSISGGLHNAFANARAIGCEAIQIFSKNQRQWRVPELSTQAVDAWRQSRKQSGVGAIMIHDSYLINLGDPTLPGAKKAREAFMEEIRRAEALDVPYLVFHPGAHMGKGEGAGIKRIVTGLDLCLAKADPSRVTLLVENTAGQGSVVGYSFEHLRDILEGVSDPSRFGVCIDTCHTFAAGYDIRTREAYDGTLRRFNETVGIKRIKAFHLNDSKGVLGCRVDRHEHIGKGHLGLEAFRLLVNDSRFSSHPMVLETPGDDPDFRRNLRVLRGLRAKRAG
jgi:deoxyribonuclease-4